MKKLILILVLCVILAPSLYAKGEDPDQIAALIKMGYGARGARGSMPTPIPIGQVDNNAGQSQDAIDKHNDLEKRGGLISPTGTFITPTSDLITPVGRPDKPKDDRRSKTLRDYLPPDLTAHRDDSPAFFDQNVKEVVYNEDGTINSVTLADGTLVSYSYERDATGRLTSFSIETDTIKIVFKLVRDTSEVHLSGMRAGPPEAKEYIIEIYDKDPGTKPIAPPAVSGQPPTQNPPISVIRKKANIDFEKLARTPIKFDFKSIDKAVSKAAELKKSALKEYGKDTLSYYNEVEKMLAKNSLFSKEKDSGPVPEQIRREAVDKSVAEAYDAQRRDGSTGILEEFISAEKILRSKILIPARDAYDARIKEAQDNINKVIEELIDSKLAIYLNTKSDKLEAVIQLPEAQK